MPISGSARRLVHGVLRRAGLDVVRYDERRFPALRRPRLAAACQVSLVLDVGANTGVWSKALRAGGYAGRIVSFEPLPSVYRELADSSASDASWSCVNVALGAVAGEARLNVAANTSSSSLLEMTAEHLRSAPESRYAGSENVRVARLDDVAKPFVRDPDRIYLKADVQGFELEVLRGAERLLPQVVVVDVELSLVPLYAGAPLYDEVIRHLEERGFGVLSLEPVLVDPDDGRLLQLDALFGRVRE